MHTLNRKAGNIWSDGHADSGWVLIARIHVDSPTWRTHNCRVLEPVIDAPRTNDMIKLSSLNSWSSNDSRPVVCTGLQTPAKSINPRDQLEYSEASR
jgi:hypothetical protein